MLDSTQLRSVKDIALARKQLQQKSAEQARSVQRDVDVLHREVNAVRYRINKVGSVLSSLFSLLSPVSSIASGLTRHIWILPLVRNLFKRFSSRRK